MKDGVPLKLDDPLLLEAVRDLKPAIFLDTAIRFSDAQSENSASENAMGLARGIFTLLHTGARVVVGIHHSPKAAAKKEATLENVLRGTGDLGAMCDAVYGLKCVNEDTLEVQVKCVKARDFEPVPPFHIQGRPFINENGDFGVLVAPGRPPEQAETEKLVEAIETDLTASYLKLSQATGIATGRIAKVAAKAGWKKCGKSWTSSKSGMTAATIGGGADELSF
jgi:hypothetical protein